MALVWLFGAGGLAALGLLSWQAHARKPREAVNQAACASTALHRPEPENTRPSEPAHTPADRLARLAWLEERELHRARLHEQLLSAVRDVSTAVERCAEIAGPHQELQALLDRAQDQLHRAARDLRSELSPLGAAPMVAGGLDTGLKHLAGLAQTASSLPVDARIHPTVEGCLPEVHAGQVLQVVREALSNALRHSGASRVALRAAVENRRFVVSVSDNGQGFDVMAPRSEFQRGIAQMQARAEAVRGLLQVESAREAGTIVTLTIPLKK